ncbi:MAG: precorrin-6A reductase [Peptococcaceae bacterium]|jgi:precorrin-6A/cobalt-precorrin-6A reductase|nr:precorrin-6A reductase [Peptococcaceae bacterium]
MIVVLAGTSEGRVLARTLAGRGRRVVACTATAYGGELLAGSGCTVRSGPLGETSLSGLVSGARVLVDATHPFAREISVLAARTAADHGIPYLRYSRPAFSLPDDPLVHPVPDFGAAALLAPRLGSVIFLATGSKTLDLFLPPARAAGCRVVARVLPAEGVVARCLSLGLSPADIVAAQGPFGREVNVALLRHFGAGVMVTKEDGAPGGLGEKLAACLELGVPLVVVGRPDEAGGEDLAEICDRAVRLDGEISYDEREGDNHASAWSGRD